jgi:hypothetical protein
MSLLTPLYALGLLAVAAPIVFHLIRRTPRGELPFSSLMFLVPSPPRLTRRSRLDQWLLLLLRATALGLLVLAFTRPFWREAAQLDAGDVGRSRVALLIDTSASMRRGDLWTRARALADQVIDGCGPADQLALFAFDTATRPLLGFEESSTLDPARRRAVARARLDRLSPTWGGTHLGQALIDAVAAVEDVADASEKAGRMPRRVVLIGDIQGGSRLEALGDFEWPSDVELELKAVSDNGPNAGLQRLAEAVDAEPSASGPGPGAEPTLRVRVSNEAGGRERFELLWVDDRGAASGKPIDVYVPPGEGRVVRVPRPPESSTPRSLRLTLKGDAQAFDNTLFFAPERRDEATVVYVGNDGPDDPAGLLYYLQRVFPDTPRRSVRVVPASPASALTWESKSPPPLIILSTETTAENVRRLQDYVRVGGTLLVVVAAPGRAETLAAIAGASPQDVEDAKVARDVLLGEIAFDHPLFAPLAGPQFNDFTKIHFWKYRRIPSDTLGDARVLARFENGDAAVAEKALGKGRLVVLASGWNPADSQLARSSKFLPLMSALLEGRGPDPFDAANHRVGDRVPLPASAVAASAEDADAARGPVVRKPDGNAVALAKGAGAFDETDQPGIYTITIDAADVGRPRSSSFAVNLDPMESKTSPLHVEALEQLGVRLANPARAPAGRDPERLRQLRNAELEGRQKFWRWLILATIGVLIVETWLAGRHKQPRSARAEVLTT